MSEPKAMTAAANVAEATFPHFLNSALASTVLEPTLFLFSSELSLLELNWQETEKGFEWESEVREVELEDTRRELTESGDKELSAIMITSERNEEGEAIWRDVAVQLFMVKVEEQWRSDK